MFVENISNFIIVVTVQFLFYIFHAYKVGESHDLKRQLLRGMALGLPFGIAFDLIIGHTFGFHDYEFGYTWWFLIINGIFSWGFMIANVFLLKHHSIIHMYLWSVSLAMLYEITNYFFPVWEWTFAPSGAEGMEYLVVVFTAYASLTALLMATMRLAYKFHFKLLPF